MPVYVALMKLTDEGARALKESPERIRAAKEKWEALGGKIETFYVLMGEYDFVAIGSAPSEWTALAWDAAMAKSGAVRTVTMKAFDEDDWWWVLNEATDEEIREMSRPPAPTRRKRDA
jgi:uncharacterized protein with GYD domain